MPETGDSARAFDLLTSEDEQALRWLTDRTNNYYNPKTKVSQCADTVLAKNFRRGTDDAHQRIKRLEAMGRLVVTSEQFAGQWSVVMLG
jgi:hypothetical protein